MKTWWRDAADYAHEIFMYVYNTCSFHHETYPEGDWDEIAEQLWAEREGYV